MRSRRRSTGRLNRERVADCGCSLFAAPCIWLVGGGNTFVPPHHALGKGEREAVEEAQKSADDANVLNKERLHAEVLPTPAGVPGGSRFRTPGTI